MRVLLVGLVVAGLGCSPKPAIVEPAGWDLVELDKKINGLTKPEVEKVLGPADLRLAGGRGVEAYWLYRDKGRTPEGVRHVRVYFDPDHDYVRRVEFLTDEQLESSHGIKVTRD